MDGMKPRPLADAEADAIIRRVDRMRVRLLAMRLLSAFLAGLGAGLLVGR